MSVTQDQATATAATTYYDRAIELLTRIKDTQMHAVEQAAELCADKIHKGGLVFMFGSGHSAMMCEEMTPRQGCFPGFVAMVEHSTSNHSSIIGSNGLRAPLYLEQYEGYAEQLLKSYRFGEHDVMWVVSTSGIRPLVVEIAKGAKDRGMSVIAMISRNHCDKAKPGHSSGKKVPDYADVVLDNQCPSGDCAVEVQGLEWRTGPTSTLTGAMLVNMVRCRTAELLIEKGTTPDLLPSHQFVGNTSVEEQLERFYESYRKSLAHLYT